MSKKPLSKEMKKCLMHARISKALKSFGQWKNRKGDSLIFVNKLRKNDYIRTERK